MLELQELHGLALYRFLLRWTLGERHAAEDLLQETFLRAWKNLAHLNADMATVRPWLFTVARRVAIDASRAKQARVTEVGVGDLADRTTGGDEIDRMLISHTVRRALATLSADHRRVLLEIYYRGRSVGEAAEILGVPEGTVKSRTYHALRALRKAVGSIQPAD
jgi:RNA polymerase sigma-70 factor (ECF subfamily)